MSSTQTQRPGTERRVFNLTDCEVRAAQDDQPATFFGYAAVFNELSVNLGGFRERIQPGCFAVAVAEGQDVRFLINHDSSLILGRTTAGTVTLTEDERGLRVECPLPDTSYARDLGISMARGDINQMSFGFTTVADEWGAVDPETNLPIRELLRANLFDVSVVTYPAYPDTEAEMRSWIEEQNPDLLARAAKYAEALAEGTLTTEQMRAIEGLPAPAAPVVVNHLRIGKKLSAENTEALEAAQELLNSVLAKAKENEEPIVETETTGERDMGETCSDPNCGHARSSHGGDDNSGACTTCDCDAMTTSDDETNAAKPEGEEREDGAVVEPVEPVEAADDPAAAAEHDEHADELIPIPGAEGVSVKRSDLEAALAMVEAARAEDTEAETTEDIKRPDFTAFRSLLEERGWSWEDDWSVYCLTQMIEIASCWLLYRDDYEILESIDGTVEVEDESELADGMSTILRELTGLLSAIVDKATGTDDAAETVENANAATEVARSRELLDLRLKLLEKEAVVFPVLNEA